MTISKTHSKMRNKEYRTAYAESYLDAAIATQMRVIRLQRGLTQAQLASKADMMQSRISAMENVSYSKWTLATLKRIASALDVRLKVSFETFGTLLTESNEMSVETLERPSFNEDPNFLVSQRTNAQLTSSMTLHVDIAPGNILCSYDTNPADAAQLAIAS
jgi:transcriptional regulator with XRE-family HTH domain